LRNCVWTLSNPCGGKRQLPLGYIIQSLPVLASIIRICDDEALIIDACLALSFIRDGKNNYIEAAVEQNIVSSLVKLLKSDKSTLIVAALRTLGNIVSGDDMQTQCVIDRGAIHAVVPLLDHTKKNIRKETCWMLSNIAAGNISQVKELLNV